MFASSKGITVKMSRASLRLMPRAALVAMIAALAPFSALHSAELAQLAPPSEYGPPTGPGREFAVPPRSRENSPSDRSRVDPRSAGGRPAIRVPYAAGGSAPPSESSQHEWAEEGKSYAQPPTVDEEYSTVQSPQQTTAPVDNQLYKQSNTPPLGDEHNSPYSKQKGPLHNPSEALEQAQKFSPPPVPGLQQVVPPVIPTPVNPHDALDHALKLSNPPAPGYPQDPAIPDELYLHDQIEQLGTIGPNPIGPNTQQSPPALQTPPSGGAAVTNAPAPQIAPGASTAAKNPPARIIRPPVALPLRRAGSGVPPAGESRLRPDEVVIEVTLATTPQAIAALEQRHGLVHLDQFAAQLQGTNQVLARIADGRTVTAVLLALQADAEVMSAQPNYLFTLQQLKQATDGAVQYAVAKLRLPQAHELATGSGVLVAIIDSGVDVAHPELEGAIAETFDTLDGSGKPHAHGTAIAGLIGGRARLIGAAPSARLLAVRAFDLSGATAEGTTFNILKGLDWAAVKGASVINLSFAGPSDPAMRRSLDGAYKNRIVLIAAAGNAGPKSPPLYPAADANVIAVTATDAGDKLFAQSNRGRHIAVAAPGVDVLVATPGRRYELLSGTSFAAAEVSGIAALIIERKPDLTPARVRTILIGTAKLLPPEGRAAPAVRLADAYRAITTDQVILPVAAR